MLKGIGAGNKIVTTPPAADAGSTVEAPRLNNATSSSTQSTQGSVALGSALKAQDQLNASLAEMRLQNQIKPKPAYSKPTYSKIDAPNLGGVGPIGGTDGAAKEQELAERLSRELKEIGVDVDPGTLNSIASAITKGGEAGVSVAVAITYAIAKAKAQGDPQIASEAIQFLSNGDPIEVAKQMTSDPNFFPIDNLPTLAMLPKGDQLAAALFSEVARQPPVTQEQERSLDYMQQLIAKIVPFVGMNPPSLLNF